ncbi:unnamed protein product [Blepharisma stoltei]|uniref:DNA-directed RNA polymerase III subunit RPC9 n=1 Tax=Blepharisma stoltei TaxID=1481888 RepID=A0AAU9IVT6_9CILI|nr:unnamed protein product [Blepharisma stoltei]
MDIVSQEAITNYEVLQCLRYNAKYRSEHPTKENLEKVKLEEEIRTYLNTTPAYNQRRESLTLLSENLQKYDLSKGEILQILNHQPKEAVELYLIIGNIEERVNEQQIQEILSLIKSSVVYLACE